MTLDLIILFGYIACMGYYIIRKPAIETILDFSLHKRAFSAKVLFFTIIATMIGGTGFVNKIELFYHKGWQYLLPVLGLPLQTLIICWLIIPKAQKTIGSVSVASFMGTYYGDTTRVITAITSSIGVSGFVASQYKIIGLTAQAFFPQIEGIAVYVILASIIIVGAYSYYGGICSVVLTDVVQSFCFILAFLFFLYYLYPSTDQLIFTLTNYNTDVFSLNTAFLNLSLDTTIEIILMTWYFLMPSFSSTQFQRFAIAKNDQQLMKAWWGASIALGFATFIPCVFSYWIFVKNPTLAKGEVYRYLISCLELPGSKAVLMVGILAMAMSTADSHLNAAAVNLANDTYRRLKADAWEKFKYARRYIIVISLVACLLSCTHDDLLRMVLFANSFYVPLVTIPLIAAIVGYTTTTRCLLFSMGLTFIAVVIGQILYYLKLITIDPFAPCMIFNGITLLISHYVVERWELLKNFGVVKIVKN